MIVFSDLDGTLLDHDSYGWEEAESAIGELKKRRIPLVLVTSKTRAEVEALRVRMGNTDPFIVENGGAAVFPGGLPLVLGATNAAAREALRKAAEATGAQVRGFGDMTIDEIQECSGLPAEAAKLASRREYGEPFVLREGSAEAMEAALHAQGFQLTRGGRFFHVLGGCDKARAVQAVSEAMGDAETAGLGDAPNDIGFLRKVKRAIIMPSAHLETMRAALPGAVVAPAAGPRGWNEAVMGLLG